ncbi:hypothetical protein ACFLRT_03265 [Acidobacteriota bacterium]
MSQGKISFELTEEAYGQIAQSIRALDSLLPFAINLTPDERKNCQTMGDKSIAFVEKAAQYADERPDLVPSYLDIPEFKKDLKLARQLRDLLMILEPSVEKISDTYLSAGSDAFWAARRLYSFVKAASDSGAPGTDSIAAELKKRYVRKKSSSQQNNGSQEEENQESND